MLSDMTALYRERAELRLLVKAREAGITVRQGKAQVVVRGGGVGMTLSHESWRQVVDRVADHYLLDLPVQASKVALERMLAKERQVWNSVEVEYSPMLNRILDRRFSL